MKTYHFTEENTGQAIAACVGLVRVGFFYAAMATLLTACGGGGGGGSSAGGITLGNTSSSSSSSSSVAVVGWQQGVYAKPETYQHKCASPRSGIDPSTGRNYEDTKGTLTDENNFLRSWSNLTYLWYSELPDLNPALYSSTFTYFDLLKTTAKTSSGKNKDNFHFTYDSAEWYALSQQGKTFSYGIEFSWLKDSPDRNVVVAYTDPGSPAAVENIPRGAKLVSIDGIDFIRSTDSVALANLNNALYPSTTTAHLFEFQYQGETGTRKITLSPADVTKTPVQQVSVLDTATGPVGYMLFNEHIKSAEQQLINAVNQFRAANITDLVLDMRYNGGGALYIASELAYMIAGDAATRGKTFEKIVLNDKLGEDTPTLFGVGENGQLASLPALNLNRVFVITSSNTCSASESVINSLRGLDGVSVIQIGGKTCGKPYGFFPEENCGTTYFTIQFKGVNHKNFGDYSDGFTPDAIDNGADKIKGCSVSDDYSHGLGDESENNLATALNYRATGSCASPSSLMPARLEKPSLGESPSVGNSVLEGNLKLPPELNNKFINKR